MIVNIYYIIINHCLIYTFIITLADPVERTVRKYSDRSLTVL